MSSKNDLIWVYSLESSMIDPVLYSRLTVTPLGMKTWIGQSPLSGFTAMSISSVRIYSPGYSIIDPGLQSQINRTRSGTVNLDRGDLHVSLLCPSFQPRKCNGYSGNTVPDQS